MSTIAMAVDKSKEAHYKDYVNFLGNYKNKKHININESDNNSVGYSLSSSANSSCSEMSEMPVKSFNEYLHDYTHKKFQPVQPKLDGKDTILSTKSKNIKTELIIQVNNADTEKEHIVKNFRKLSIPNEKSQSKHFQQIQKKFNLKPETEIQVPLTVIRLNSLESNNVNKPNIRKSSINNQYRSNAASESKSNQEKLVENNENIPKKVINALDVNESFLSRQKSHPKTLVAQENDNLPKKIVTSKIYIATTTLPTNEISPTISPSSKEVQRVISSNKIDDLNSPSMVPPPPPPPVPTASFTPELRYLPPITKTPSSKSQSHTLPRMMSNGQKIQKDTVDASTINRNDPRMKKAVYGALRNMYGAYHEKANDYLATLPKNRVKKGNGLDSIIDSIAAQGGLEKLCGRAKVEAD